MVIFSFIWIFLPAILKLFHVKIWRFSRISSWLGLKAFQITVEVEGLNHINPNGHYIFLANHKSWFDQLALCVALPMPLHFMANEKFFRYPLLKHAMRLYEHIAVFPQNRGKAMPPETKSSSANNKALRSLNFHFIEFYNIEGFATNVSQI